MLIAALFIIARMEATWMSIDRWMGKEVVVCVCVCDGILLSHIKEQIWVPVRWMNQEPVVQSEVNQKSKYRILMHICGI